MALCEASKEAVWLDKLIQRVTMLVTQSDNLVGPVNIKIDNSGCIDFAKNPVEHKRTKHIDIRYHFVRAVSALLLQGGHDGRRPIRDVKILGGHTSRQVPHGQSAVRRRQATGRVGLRKLRFIR